jgi:hypothetical protein
MPSSSQNVIEFTGMQVPVNIIRSLVTRLEQTASFPAAWLAR